MLCTLPIWSKTLAKAHKPVGRIIHTNVMVSQIITGNPFVQQVVQDRKEKTTTTTKTKTTTNKPQKHKNNNKQTTKAPQLEGINGERVSMYWRRHV